MVTEVNKWLGPKADLSQLGEAPLSKLITSPKVWPIPNMVSPIRYLFDEDSELECTAVAVKKTPVYLQVLAKQAGVEHESLVPSLN